MTEEELRDLVAAKKRAGEIERIGEGLASTMRQASRQSAACLAQDLAAEVASVRRDIGKLAEHVLGEAAPETTIGGTDACRSSEDRRAL